MGWKNLFKGVEMPDANDPKYQKLHDDASRAGENFARYSGLNWLCRRIVLFANAHRILFLVLVFSFTIFAFLFQTWRLIKVQQGRSHYVPVTEQVDSMLDNRFIVSDEE